MTLNKAYSFDSTTEKNVSTWLEGEYDTEVKAQIRHLLKEDPQQILDAFYTHLTFGTGGLRGLMGIGTNRMNVYTVRAATQGLANYIHTQPHAKNQTYAVCVGYDSRDHSQEFAQEAAKVLAGNAITAYLFHELRPTPLVSFACRYQHCIAAIMMTASHNPPNYNGYKVYWTDGGQISTPHDKAILAEIMKVIDPSMVRIAPSVSNPFIKEIKNEIDDAYLQAIENWQNYPEVNFKEGSKLKVVYTSLHGTGITMVPKALFAWGFPKVEIIESQMMPNGSFPTIKVPNPEEPAALKIGIDHLIKTKGDILIATDPDADRIGIAVFHESQAIHLDGHQIAVLCLEHICSALSKKNQWPLRAAFVKTIGMTDLFQAICEEYKHPCFNVLTGFKYIAEKIREWESLPNGHQYIFGGEESGGYLLGTCVRDKDAIISSVLLSEAALQAKLEDKTLIDKLHELYQKYGIYQEMSCSIQFKETKEGKELMALAMHGLRKSKLCSIFDIPVTVIEDYSISTRFDLISGKNELLHLPKANILLYRLVDGTKFIIRPSGTEPKIKLYCEVCDKLFSKIAEGKQACLQRCEKVLQWMKQEFFHSF